MAKRGGKYRDKLRGLPKFQSENPKHNQLVSEVKQAIIRGNADLGINPIPMQAAALAEEYALLRREKDDKKAELSDVQLRLDAVVALMEEQFEAEGVLSMTLSDGSQIRLDVEPYAVVRDHDKVRQWAKDNDLERSLQLPWTKLNAILKQFVLQGEPPPDGVEAWQKSKPWFSDGRVGGTTPDSSFEED